MCGGGKHKDKKRVEEASRDPSEVRTVARTAGAEGRRRIGERQVSGDPGVRQDAVVEQLEENEGYRKIMACVSEGSDTEVGQKMQCYLVAAHESGLGKGQV